MGLFDSEDTQDRDAAILIDINNNRDAMRYDNAGTREFTLTKDGFMDCANGWKDRYASVYIGDVAKDSDDFKYPLLRAMSDITITNIELTLDTTLDADGSNYESIAFHRSGASAALFTALTTTAGLALKTPSAVSGITSAAGAIPKDETFYMAPTMVGTGGILSGVGLHITYTIDRPEAQTGTVTDNVLRAKNGEAGTDGLIQTDHLQRDSLQLKRNGVEVLTIDVDGIMRGGCDYTPVDLYHYAVVNVGTIIAADSAAKKSAIFKPGGTATIKKVFFGADTVALADSETAYMEVIITDDSSNRIGSAFVHGPASSGTALVAGRLYDMGELNETYATIASTEHAQVEYLALGSPADIAGLTVIIAYTYI